MIKEIEEYADVMRRHDCRAHRSSARRTRHASATFLALVDRVATYVVEINGEDYVCLGTSGMGVVVRRWDDEKACGVGPRITSRRRRHQALPRSLSDHRQSALRGASLCPFVHQPEIKTMRYNTRGFQNQARKLAALRAPRYGLGYVLLRWENARRVRAAS
jgi:hypothetical protein